MPWSSRTRVVWEVSAAPDPRSLWSRITSIPICHSESESVLKVATPTTSSWWIASAATGTSRPWRARTGAIRAWGKFDWSTASSSSSPPTSTLYCAGISRAGRKSCMDVTWKSCGPFSRCAWPRARLADSPSSSMPKASSGFASRNRPLTHGYHSRVAVTITPAPMDMTSRLCSRRGKRLRSARSCRSGTNSVTCTLARSRSASEQQASAARVAATVSAAYRLVTFISEVVR